MTKPFAALIALAFVVVVFSLTTVFLWGIIKQFAATRDKGYAKGLREHARLLEAQGFLEAADRFRDYARMLDEPAEERQRLKQS